MALKHLVLLSILGLFLPSPAFAGDAPSRELDVLREDLNRLRSDYQKQMERIERRIKQLEQRAGGAAPETAVPAPAVAENVADPFESTETETIDVRREEGLHPMVEKIVRKMPSPFEFHGYLRSGFGVNERGGDQEAFQAPVALSKYRLGNETETYLETQFTYNVLPEKFGTAYPAMKVQIRPSIKTGNNGTYDSLNDEPSNDIALREAFAQIANVVDNQPELSFWAGQRFYRREDIHIIDFYWLDMSGYGGGFENLDLGEAKMALAWIGGSDDDFESERGRAAKQSLDLRLYGIDVPFGSGTFWSSYSRSEAAVSQDGTFYSGADGAAFGVIHEREGLLGGTNKLSFQYGFGSASTFSTFIDEASPPDDGSKRLRLTEHFTIQPIDQVSMQAVLIGEHRTGGGLDGSESWISAGARPIVHLNDYVSLAFEGGADWVKSEDEGFSDTLWKFTFAPQLAPAPTFYSRPVLRMFVTYAVWGDELRDRVGGDTYLGRTDGFSMGTQVEAWW